MGGTLLAGIEKAGFKIFATRGIAGRGSREDQLSGVIADAQRARRNINGMKWSQTRWFANRKYFLRGGPRCFYVEDGVPRCKTFELRE
jgi:hypothetical protein